MTRCDADVADLNPQIGADLLWNVAELVVISDKPTWRLTVVSQARLNVCLLSFLPEDWLNLAEAKLETPNPLITMHFTPQTDDC